MRADIYCRKSTPDQGKSVRRQDSECREAIDQLGWETGQFFADDSISASRYTRRARASYEALQAHVAAGQCEVLVLYEVSRLARWEIVGVTFLETCRTKGVKIHVVMHDRTYDPRRMHDWNVLVDEVNKAARESALLSERSQSGKRALARDGKPAGKLLYGYLREYDPATGAYLRQTEHPEQAPVVRRMATRLLATHSCRRVATELNEDGVQRLDGQAAWTGRDVHRYLSNPAYVQRRVHQGVAMATRGDWPAILDEDTWTRVQAVLSNPARRTREGGSDLVHWLVGAMTCGRCSGPMVSHQGGRGQRYQCKACGRVAIKAEDLEDFIGRVVREVMSRPGAARAFRPRQNTGALAAARARVRTLEAELAEWRALAVARRVSPASFAEIEAGLLPRLDAAVQEVRSLELPDMPAELEGVDVAARWDDLSPILKRVVVRILMDIAIQPSQVKGGRFRPERVEISWRNA